MNTIAVQALFKKMNKKSKVSVDRYDGILQEHCGVSHNGLGTPCFFFVFNIMACALLPLPCGSLFVRLKCKRMSANDLTPKYLTKISSYNKMTHPGLDAKEIPST